jgi:hypothetical protein
MEQLSNKIKELNELTNEYKNRDEIISKKKAETAKEGENEERQILSHIRDVEKSLPSTGFEIEDTEPFFQDPAFKRPGNKERYFLVATQRAIRVRVYKGDTIKDVKPPEEYNLSILRPLNERFPKFVDVIIKKAREALE